MSKTIEDILKDMPLDDSVKSGLRESWNAALGDAKIAQEAQVREELSDRFDTDMEKMQEALGTFLEERVKPHVEDLQESVTEVEGMKVAYASKIAKIKEAAQNYVRTRLGAAEKVVEAHVHKELSELHEDVVANRRAALRAVAESKAQSDRDREVFRAKAAKVLESIINIKVPAQLEPLREDIEAARRDDFGREIFEAFQTVFRRNFFNTSDEVQNLVSDVAKLTEKVNTIKAKATKVVRKSHDETVAAKKAYSRLNESVTRQKTLARLLKPLKGNTRAQMKTILEASKTEKLDTTFRKALPQIVREAKSRNVSSKKSLHEGKKKVQSMEFRSGGTKPLSESTYDEFDDEVANIRRLAGNQ